MIRGATISGLVVGTVLAVIVFAIKYDVQDLEAEYQSLNRQIERDRQAIHVLKAEWSYLNEPKRLRELARLHLGASNLTAEQMGKLNLIPMRYDGPLDGYNQPGEPGLGQGNDPPGLLNITDRMAAIEAVLQELRDSDKQRVSQ
jgi:hypothetical protein